MKGYNMLYQQGIIKMENLLNLFLRDSVSLVLSFVTLMQEL